MINDSIDTATLSAESVTGVDKFRIYVVNVLVKKQS